VQNAAGHRVEQQLAAGREKGNWAVCIAGVRFTECLALGCKPSANRTVGHPGSTFAHPIEQVDRKMPQTAHWVHGPIFTQARACRIGHDTDRGQREISKAWGSSAGAGRETQTVLWWMVRACCRHSFISCRKRIRFTAHRKPLDRGPGPKRGSVFCGQSTGCGDRPCEVRQALFMPGEQRRRFWCRRTETTTRLLAH